MKRMERGRELKIKNKREKKNSYKDIRKVIKGRKRDSKTKFLKRKRTLKRYTKKKKKKE